MKEKIVRTIYELPKKYISECTELLEEALELYEVRKDLEESKKENSNRLISILIDLDIDSIKSDIGTVTLADRKPLLNDSNMKETLKKNFKMPVVEEIIRAVKRSKEELLIEELEARGIKPKKLAEIVEASKKEAEPSVTFRPANGK